MGAKVDEKNNEGYIAIDWTGNVVIKKMLNEAMKKQNVQAFKSRRENSLGE